MNCNVCGNLIKEGATFCNSCGKSIRVIKPPPISIPVKMKDEVKHIPKELKRDQKRRSYSSRVMVRGRVTIPLQIREALNLKEEDYLVFSIEGDTVTVSKAGKKKRE